MPAATNALISWLDELDLALVAAEPSAEGERRIDALIDEGVCLLTDDAPADTSMIDAHVADRVQRRLWAIADQVSSELDTVRRARWELARVAELATAS